MNTITEQEIKEILNNVWDHGYSSNRENNPYVNSYKTDCIEKYTAQFKPHNVAEVKSAEEWLDREVEINFKGLFEEIVKDNDLSLFYKSVIKEFAKEYASQFQSAPIVDDNWISNFKIEFEEGIIAEDTNGFIGVIDRLKIVDTGETKEKCFEECLISLKVLLAYNSGIKINK